ncbi:MAG: ornithine cyclodeaminase family protein [Alphaproteobacteria bacterium]|nr:MAG: ornithine cyclodeaminase family protein [Alphaproteobacteria bacterium]
MRIIHDEEVRERFDFSRAIDEIERILAARSHGAFRAPARHYQGNDIGDLAFTIGGDAAEGTFGFRVYPRYRAAGSNSQFTAVYDATTGVLEGLVFGDYLGAARTGAIGGAAVKRMAPENAETLALLGTGLQAETQLRAACEVRTFKSVRIFSRDQEKREAFCERMATLVSADLIPVENAESALEGANVAITATNAKSPICDSGAFESVAHINAIGPKFRRANELPEKLYGMMDLMVSDSLEQITDYDLPESLLRAKAFAGLEDLAKITTPKRPPATRSLFLSVGLAGTEPCVARLLF